MSKNQLPTSLSPKLSLSPPLNKSHLHTFTDTRLSFLLDECKKLQSTLAFTWKNINEKASGNSKALQSIKKQIDQRPVNYKFREAYYNRKAKFCKKKTAQPSETQQKITSLLETVPAEEIFSFERSNCKSFEGLSLNKYIEVEEMSKPEAVDLLRNNKRKFGEQFKKEISKRIMTLNNSKNKKSFPYLSKTSLRSQQKELIDGYLKEKERLNDRVAIEHLIHLRAKKFK